MHNHSVLIASSNRMQHCDRTERVNTINVTITFSPTLYTYSKADQVTGIFSKETFKTGAFLDKPSHC